MSLIIIGSGLAGYMLAKEWRKLDAQTPLVIITRDDGAFYSKPLLSTALTQQKTPEQLVVSNAATMAQELNAKIYTHSTVTAVDPVTNQVIVNQERLGFSRLVFACGAEVIKLPLKGDAVQEIQSVNTLSDYRHFRQWLTDKKHIVILGTGLVGCEFANDLVNAGYAVTLIAPDAYPLIAALPAPVGHSLRACMAKQGVVWRLGESATAVNRCGAEISVTLSGGQEIVADGVLAAVGLRPRIALAGSAGLVVNQGIVVNSWLQTHFPHIFALGDCAEIAGRVQMYIAPLLQSARALAKILTEQGEPVHFPVMPVVVKTPALPLVFSPAPPDVIGEWRLEGEGHHLRALFHDEQGLLRGFVLAGDKIRDKMPLAKQLALAVGGE